MTGLPELLAVLSGVAVGFSLGLIGGGGSILAVPLLLYFVGVGDPHIAIGTSALAVAVSALLNLIGHWRRGTVKWPCALVFAAFGIVGAMIGSTLGKLANGQHLVFLFALLMIVIGLSMLRPPKSPPNPGVRIDARIAVLLALLGFLVGGVSGFFGIGGGFLIVPGLIFATNMPILNAIGSSLVSVTAFGLTTSANYALSGLIDWSIALGFIGGGILGGWFGRQAAVRLAGQRRTLNYVFVGVIFTVAVYMLIRTGATLFS